MNRKRILALVVIGAAVAFGVWKFLQTTRQDSGEAALTLYGNVDIRDVVLAFRVGGRIDEIRFDEGDHVKKGTILAVLDREPFDEQYALAKARLAEAEATLNSASRNFNRNTKLLETGTVSQRLYDESLAARDEAHARVLTAKVQVDQAETALKDTELKAPSDGTVLTRIRERGSVVAAGQPVLTLAVDNNVWVRAYVDEPSLGHVHPGQSAMVFTDTRPDRPYKGQIGFISPQAEFTPKNVETRQLRSDLVYRLRVIVLNPDEGLRQGMPVTVRIQTDGKGAAGQGRDGNAR